MTLGWTQEQGRDDGMWNQMGGGKQDQQKRRSAQRKSNGDRKSKSSDGEKNLWKTRKRRALVRAGGDK